MTNYNLNDSFQKLLESTFIVYGGLRWEKTDAGFIHNGFLARDHHEMDLLVEQEISSLKNSLKNITHHEQHRI